MMMTKPAKTSQTTVVFISASLVILAEVHERGSGVEVRSGRAGQLGPYAEGTALPYHDPRSNQGGRGADRWSPVDAIGSDLDGERPAAEGAEGVNADLSVYGVAGQRM